MNKINELWVELYWLESEELLHGFYHGYYNEKKKTINDPIYSRQMFDYTFENRTVPSSLTYDDYELLNNYSPTFIEIMSETILNTASSIPRDVIKGAMICLTGFLLYDYRYFSEDDLWESIQTDEFMLYFIQNGAHEHLLYGTPLCVVHEDQTSTLYKLIAKYFDLNEEVVQQYAPTDLKDLSIIDFIMERKYQYLAFEDYTSLTSDMYFYKKLVTWSPRDK